MEVTVQSHCTETGFSPGTLLLCPTKLPLGKGASRLEVNDSDTGSQTEGTKLSFFRKEKVLYTFHPPGGGKAAALAPGRLSWQLRLGLDLLVSELDSCCWGPLADLGWLMRKLP